MNYIVEKQLENLYNQQNKMNDDLCQLVIEIINVELSYEEEEQNVKK